MSSGEITGIIEKGVGGIYQVNISPEVLECKPRGSLRKDRITPLPGDRVRVTKAEQGLSVIEEVLPRKNSLYRPAAANIDALLIVMASTQPEPDMYLLDKLLVLAEIKGIRPIICINKTDLDGGEHLERVKACYEKIGYRVVGISATGDPERSRQELNQVLTDCGTTVLTGQSGVGKSTVVNLILGQEHMLRGTLSAKIQKGKNTTRHAELVMTPGGHYIVDTPGFTNFVNEGVFRYELKNYYPEFVECGDQCRFSDCRHEAEPDCAVKARVHSGEIDSSRYQRYLELTRSLKTSKWSE